MGHLTYPKHPPPDDPAIAKLTLDQSVGILDQLAELRASGLTVEELVCETRALAERQGLAPTPEEVQALVTGVKGKSLQAAPTTNRSARVRSAWKRAGTYAALVALTVGAIGAWHIPHPASPQVATTPASTHMPVTGPVYTVDITYQGQPIVHQSTMPTAQKPARVSTSQPLSLVNACMMDTDHRHASSQIESRQLENSVTLAPNAKGTLDVTVDTSRLVKVNQFEADGCRIELPELSFRSYKGTMPGLAPGEHDTVIQGDYVVTISRWSDSVASR